jgi:hypothetical protein
VGAARFDVYGRYELDVERRGDRWVVYARGEGKRRERPDIFVPAAITDEALGAYLDDLLHEEGSRGVVIRRLPYPR